MALDCCTSSIIAAGFSGNRRLSVEGATHTCQACGRRWRLQRVPADACGRVVHLQWNEITDPPVANAKTPPVTPTESDT